jgi:hypothetical protein
MASRFAIRLPFPFQHQRAQRQRTRPADYDEPCSFALIRETAGRPLRPQHAICLPTVGRVFCALSGGAGARTVTN